MKICKDKKYQTRDGRDVRIYATDGHYDHEVHGAIKTVTGWISGTWNIAGKFMLGRQSKHDLVEAPKVHERWFNVYETNLGGPHHSKEEADSRAAPTRLGPAQKVTFTIPPEDDQTKGETQ